MTEVDPKALAAAQPLNPTSFNSGRAGTENELA
jgi:hypothetical protein